MLGFTSILLQRDVTDEQRREYLAIIEAQARWLGALVNDFLDVQHLEEGKLSIAKELVDIGSVVREQSELFAGRARSTCSTSRCRRRPCPCAVI